MCKLRKGNSESTRNTIVCITVTFAAGRPVTHTHGCAIARSLAGSDPLERLNPHRACRRESPTAQSAEPSESRSLDACLCRFARQRGRDAHVPDVLVHDLVNRLAVFVPAPEGDSVLVRLELQDDCPGLCCRLRAARGLRAIVKSRTTRPTHLRETPQVGIGSAISK
jgi:hypothetical protein